VAEDVLGGYRLLKVMMTGQTSQVWEVVEISSQRHFAIKMLLPEHADKFEMRSLLFHEAEVGKKLAHPNVIKVVHVNKDPKNPYFVMEFFPGGSLKARMLAKQADFIREQAPNIFKQAATAFAYMNSTGWVHRDVKPDNLLVNSAGELKVIDFALSRRAEKPPTFFGSLFTKKRKVQGTRSYMSPEQIRGEWLDGRSDIYSFGATCFELVTGRPPFRGTSSDNLLTKHLIEKPVTPQSFNPEVTNEFADLVLRMLGKRREDRPRDFHEVLMKLRTIKVYKETKSAG
jgi:serine/threonine protein kinase